VLEDKYARQNLGWNPDYNLEKIVKEMMEVIKGKRT
jgi:GDP-D-mannose dehydratase